jgi:hypothetical protein
MSEIDADDRDVGRGVDLDVDRGVRIGGGRLRRRARRVVVVGFVALQLFLVVRAYWAPHREFGFQMFPEASRWRADIVRVTADGDRLGIEEPWFGYEWNRLVGVRGLSSPWRTHHADSGVDRQLAFLDEALDWVSTHTPDDHETSYYEADVTVWRNMGTPTTLTIRGPERDLP